MAIARVIPLSILFGAAGADAIVFDGGRPRAARLLRDVGPTRDQAEREGLRDD
jgi:hypothetical protein